MVIPTSAKLTQRRVNVSDKTLARHWRKRFKKSKTEVEAAVAKVGDNPETVMKQLASAKR
jgi:Protein of unknown function (DUF3606)